MENIQDIAYFNKYHKPNTVQVTEKYITPLVLGDNIVLTIDETISKINLVKYLVHMSNNHGKFQIPVLIRNATNP